MIEFKVGDRVHTMHVADSYPGTVVEVSSRAIFVREDSHRKAPGAQMYSQDWIIEENPNGIVRKFTRRSDGTYREVGSSAPVVRPGWKYYYSYEF